MEPRVGVWGKACEHAGAACVAEMARESRLLGAWGARQEPLYSSWEEHLDVWDVLPTYFHSLNLFL